MIKAIRLFVCVLFFALPISSKAITLGELLNPYDTYFANCDYGDANLQALCTAVQTEVNGRLAQAGLSIDHGDLVFTLNEGTNNLLFDNCSRSTTLTGMGVTARVDSTASVTLRGNTISKPAVFGISIPLSIYARADMMDVYGASVGYLGGFPPRWITYCSTVGSDHYYGDLSTSMVGVTTVLLSLEPRYAVSDSQHLVIQLQPVVDVSAAVEDFSVNLDFHGVSLAGNVAQGLLSPFNYLNDRIDAIYDAGSIEDIFTNQEYVTLKHAASYVGGAVLTDYALDNPLHIDSFVNDYLQSAAYKELNGTAQGLASDVENKLRSKIAAALDLDANGKVIYAFDFGLNRVTPTAADREAIAKLERGYVYRYYHYGMGEHFYSVSRTEGLPHGYTLEGLMFTLRSTQVSGTAPLYRCWIPQISKHLVSVDEGCEGSWGATNEGVYGYAYTYPETGTVPLYRFYAGSDHLVTTDYYEGAYNGFTYEGVLGYVFLP